MAEVSQKSLSRQALWVVGGRCIGIGATFASNILAARLLGPGEYGSFLLISTVLVVGALFAMVGLNEAGLRFVAEALGHGHYDQARNNVARALKLAAQASLVVAPISALVTYFFLGGQPITRLLLAVLVAVGILALVWQKLGTELTRAYGDLKWVSFLSGGQTGGPLSNLVFVAALSGTALGIWPANARTTFALLVISICASAPFVYGILRHAITLSDGLREPEGGLGGALSAPGPTDRHSLFAVTLLIFSTQLLGFAAQQIDLWIAGLYLTTDAVGLFGAAKRAILIVAMPVQMATMTIVGVIPRLYATKQIHELQRTVRGAATLAAIPSLVALVAIALAPQTALRLVFGDAFVGAAGPLLMLALGQAFLVISGNPQHVLTMTGRQQAVFATNLVAAAILIGGGIVGACYFGAAGLAAASAGSLAFQNGSMWWIVRRELKIRTDVDFRLVLPFAKGRSSAKSAPPENSASVCPAAVTSTPTG